MCRDLVELGGMCLTISKRMAPHPTYFLALGVVVYEKGMSGVGIVLAADAL